MSQAAFEPPRGSGVASPEVADPTCAEYYSSPQPLPSQAQSRSPKKARSSPKKPEDESARNGVRSGDSWSKKDKAAEPDPAEPGKEDAEPAPAKPEKDKPAEPAPAELEKDKAAEPAPAESEKDEAAEPAPAESEKAKNRVRFKSHSIGDATDLHPGTPAKSEVAPSNASSRLSSVNSSGNILNEPIFFAPNSIPRKLNAPGSCPPAFSAAGQIEQSSGRPGSCMMSFSHPRMNATSPGLMFSSAFPGWNGEGAPCFTSPAPYLGGGLPVVTGPMQQLNGAIVFPQGGSYVGGTFHMPSGAQIMPDGRCRLANGFCVAPVEEELWIFASSSSAPVAKVLCDGSVLHEPSRTQAGPDGCLRLASGTRIEPDGHTFVAPGNVEVTHDGAVFLGNNIEVGADGMIYLDDGRVLDPYSIDAGEAASSLVSQDSADGMGGEDEEEASGARRAAPEYASQGTPGSGPGDPPPEQHGVEAWLRAARLPEPLASYLEAHSDRVCGFCRNYENADASVRSNTITEFLCKSCVTAALGIVGEDAKCRAEGCDNVLYLDSLLLPVNPSRLCRDCHRTGGRRNGSGRRGQKDEAQERPGPARTMNAADFGQQASKKRPRKSRRSQQRRRAAARKNGADGQPPRR